MVDATQLLTMAFVPAGGSGRFEARGCLSIARQHLKEQQIAGAVAASLALKAFGQTGERQVLAAATGNIPPLNKHLAATCVATGIHDEPLRQPRQCCLFAFDGVAIRRREAHTATMSHGLSTVVVRSQAMPRLTPLSLRAS